MLQERRESFLKYIPSKTIIFSKNKELLLGNLDTLFTKAENAFSELSKEIQHCQTIRFIL